MSDIKKYKIKLVDKENSISLIKSFLSKYDYKKRNFNGRIKNWIYGRPRTNIF